MPVADPKKFVFPSRGFVNVRPLRGVAAAHRRVVWRGRVEFGLRGCLGDVVPKAFYRSCGTRALKGQQFERYLESLLNTVVCCRIDCCEVEEMLCRWRYQDIPSWQANLM